MDFLNKYLEAAALLILIYLVVTNFVGFSSVVSSLSSANVGAIRALQGQK
jgi:hypothetical protein